MPEFTTKIGKIGINPVVEPPEKVLNAIFANAGKDKGAIRVRGTINGADLRQTLVRFRGEWRLYINGEMCRSAGVGVGDTVTIVLEYDSEPRVDIEPERLTAALAGDPKAREAFDALPSSRRREIISYLGSLKTDEALTRNLERVLRQLQRTSE